MNDRCDDVIVARKYAQAFVNVHAAAVSVRLLDCFLKAESFLQRQHDVLFLLSIPYLEQQQRNQMVKTLVAYFSLPIQCEQLFLLMILQHRFFLIPEVLWHIAQIYKKRVNTLAFHITSSHELDEAELTEIKLFLEYKTGKEIIYSYDIDKNLIAGIRLTSEEYTWEYSVRKHINALACSINK